MAHFPPKKRPAKHFSVAEKLSILNIFKAHEEANPTRAKTDNVEQTARETGVCEGSVWRIIREHKTQLRLKPPKRYNRKRNILDNLNEETKATIKLIVHSFLGRNEQPTIDKVLTAVTENKDLPNFKRSTLRTLLNEIGFQFPLNLTANGEAGPSTITDLGLSANHPISIPINTNTDQFLCKVEAESDDEGENIEPKTEPTSPIIPSRLPEYETLSISKPHPELVSQPDELSCIKREWDDFDESPNIEPISFTPLIPPDSPVTPISLDGRRIVDLNYVLEWSMQVAVDHSKACPDSKLVIVKEEKHALISEISFKCEMCKFTITKSTEDRNTGSMNLFLSWIKVTPCTVIEKLFSILRIPF